MSNKVQKTIEINAKVKTSLEGMEKTISDLEKGLEKQKFDLNKNSGLSKLIKDYKEAKSQLDELMDGDQIARTDIKKAEQLGEKVSRLYKKIGTSFRELQNGSEETFKNLFPSSFTTQITKGTQAIDKFFSKLGSKGDKESRVNEITKDITILESELDQLKNRRLNIDIKTDREAVKKDLQRIEKDIEEAKAAFKLKLFPEEVKDSKGRTQTDRLQSSVTTWDTKLANDKQARKNLTVGDLTSAQKRKVTNLEGQLTDSSGVDLTKAENARLQGLLAEKTKREQIAKTPGAQDKGRLRREYGNVSDKELSAQIAASEKEIKRLQSIVEQIEQIKAQPRKAYEAAVKKLDTQIKTDETNLKKAQDALRQHSEARQIQESVADQKVADFTAGKPVAEATQDEVDAFKLLNEEKAKSIELDKKLRQEKGFETQEDKDNAVGRKQGSIEKKTREMETLKREIQSLTEETNIEEFFKKLEQLGVNTEGLDHTEATLKEIKKDLQELNTQTTDKIRQQLTEIGKDADKTEDDVDGLRQGFVELGNTNKDLTKAESEIENLKNQVLQFFSLTNAVQLFKRAVTSAMNTVKELDATMTEAAVVTEFDVGDMWDKLPQYSKNAQQLGVSINGMYQATTLYYQQGLKTNEAMALGVETMKMAKIAGLESVDATKAMTAALRGFNMELNETSATRVNDVYSQLAAVTAADVNQISTAMEKTASIAASANMEFETTAALLAQIIETTQEAPETAGTAMKTIIARFSEVKDLKAKGQITGQDSEGEAIDVNKIQTALRTVGIDMEGFFSGTKGLDSILLELAGKWDTLDFETQRYIATMAAGSRQQSRFIAMMSDYKRTTELVSEANNSAGASQAQFSKTLESMESKIQKLKNAWDQFLMGLSNNEVLKFGVDLLTGFLETINKIVDGISGGNGLIKSVTSLVAVIGTMKMGKSLLSSTGIGNMFGRITGQGATKETITETKNKETGEIIRTVVRQPLRQGEAAGKEAGTGFVAGFKRALKENKDGEKTVKGFIKNVFTKTEDIKTVDEGSIKKNLGQMELGLDETDLSERAMGIRRLNEELADGQISADQAAQQYQALGGDIDDLASHAQATVLDFKAMGQAAMGVGAALGGLSAIFSSMELDGAAKAVSILAGVFMGLGTVMTTLSTIAPMLGMSFTSAGIQITTAGVTCQLAWWWVFVIIAAIAALIALFVVLAKKAKAASLEGRMEAAAKATEAAKKAAEEAKQAYEDLLSDKSEYDEVQNKLSELTRGTLEWKQALAEANNSVIELLGTYPELAQYLQHGAYGQLTISDEGFDFIMKQQQELVARTSSNVVSKQLAQAELEQEKIQNALNKKAYDSGIIKVANTAGRHAKVKTDTAAVSSIYRAYQQFGAELFRKEANGEYSQAMQDLAKQIGHTAEEIYKMKEALGEYDKALIENKKQMIGYAKAFLQTVVSQEQLQYKYSEQLIAGLSEGLEDARDRKTKDYKNKLKAERIKKNDDFYVIAKEYGLEEEDFSGRGKKRLRKLYAKMAGVKEDDSSVTEKSKQELKEEIAKMYADKQIGKDTEKLYDSIKKLSATDQRIYSAAFSGDTSNLTKADLDAFGQLNVETMATALGYASKEDMALAMGYVQEDGETADTEAMAKAIEQLGNKIEVDYEKITQKGLKMGLEKSQLEKDYLKGMTVGQTSAYVELMTQALGAGQTGFQDSFDQVMSSANNEQKQQILESLDAFDFTKEGSAQQFMDFLSQIGVSLPISEAEKFEKELEGLSSAFKTIDISKLRDQIKELLDLGDSLSERKSSQGVTQEEYEKLIESELFSKSDFVWTGQEWVYLEGPMSDLQKAIEDNTQAIINKNKDELEEQIEQGEKIKAIDESYGEIMTWTRYNSETGLMAYEGMSKQDFMSGKANAGVARYLLGLDDSMTDAEVLQYYKTALANYPKLAANKESLGKLNNQNQFMVNKNKQAMSIEYGSQDYATDLLAQARLYDVSEAAISNFNKALNTGSSETINAAMTTLKNTIEQKKQEQQYGKTLSKLQEVKEQYGEITDYASASTETINDYGEALGLDMTVADNYKFVANNLGLIQGAAEGNIAAILEMNKLLMESNGLSFGENGLLNLSGSNIDTSKKQVQEYLLAQYEAASLQMVEVVADTKMPYLVPKYDETGKLIGFETKTVKAGEKVQTLKTADMNSITQALNSSGQGSDNWENPYDRFYNTLEKINGQLRERERLEKRYQKLLKDSSSNVSDIVANQENQLKTLYAEKALQQYLSEGKTSEIQAFMSANSKYGQYAQYDNKTGEIMINYAAIDAIKGSAQGEAVEEYISKLEELRDQQQDAIDAIYDIDDQIEDLKDQGKDEYLDLENRIKEAVVYARQEEIDKLSAINDSINDTNSNILDAMQKQLDEYRQQRDNEKTEQEIADKQRRLAYLQQDTSGANAMEILNLQKEIEQAQEDYTDTLIDQKISALQEQNDLAAKQREYQIGIMQQQLDQEIASGGIWKEVTELWKKGIGEKGILLDSQLYTMLQDSESWKGLSDQQKTDWAKELVESSKAAISWQSLSEKLTTGSLEQDIKDAAQTVVTGTLTDAENVETGNYSVDKTTLAGNVETILKLLQDMFPQTPETPPTEANTSGLWEYDSYLEATYGGRHLLPRLPRHAKGGLVDYTGLAWLDGTKTNPEYVLSADQTKAFFNLVDVLGSLQGGSATTTQNNRDNTYDIDINVESIGNDYDVERLADTVKRLINEEARYRNNNTINLMR